MFADTTSNGVSDIWTIVAQDGSKATIHSQGGHVTSWVGTNGDERLYMSPNAVYEAGKALRGGVPVIYPQFSDMGKGSTHGVARSRQWSRIDSDNESGVCILEFSIHKGDQDFPGCESRLTLTVTVSNEQLKLTAKVDGTTTDGTTDKDGFGFAFHTYFGVSDISKVSLEGFVDGMTYADNLEGRKMIPAADAVSITRIDGETDRIYTAVKGPLTIIDAGKQTALEVSGENLPDVVLWNPWSEKNARLSDLPQPDGYKHFVCIEHGALLPRIPFPAEGMSWEGSQVVNFKKI